MREEESNWFSKWEEDLPSPEELMPLSQSLITPDLALAFDIRTSTTTNASNHNPNTVINNHPQSPLPNQPNQNLPISLPNLGGSGALAAPSSAEFAADSGELGSGGGTGDARTLKRPRLVWTPQLHKRFVDAVAHLGIKNAVPKTIMQLMSVDGLTRENVASHLQKYRLYLKRMQGLSGGGGGGGAGAGGNGGGGGGLVAAADPATEHLFASGPVPPHFLHPGGARGSSEHFMPYVPVAALQHQQQQQMVAAAAAAAVGQHPQYHRPVGGAGHYGQFEHAYMARQGVHRVGAPIHSPLQGYVEDLESGTANGGRKVLTLFPTGDE